MKKNFWICSILLLASCMEKVDESNIENWEAIFDGTNLSDWTPKFMGFDVGENYKNTFRLTDSLIHVSYDQYDSFNNEFGHLFFKKKYSHYRLRATYRFMDVELKNRPDWAFANNGLMLHSQPVKTMAKDQPFPLSIEFQLLQGYVDEIGRATGRFCTPACEVDYEGSQYPYHCQVDYAGPVHPLETWVEVEAIVYGDSLVHHVVEGDTVVTYTNIRIGGDLSEGLNTDKFVSGNPLSDGYIALQAEGHDTQFKKIKILNLCGCMDAKAKNYKSYFVKDDPKVCKY